MKTIDPPNMSQTYRQTPSQTVGPYFAYGLTPEQYHYPFPSIADNYLFKDTPPDAERIILRGRIFDGAGQVIDDAMVELIQDDTLEGFGRFGTGTEPDNSYIFHTIKPQGGNGQAPFIHVILTMRGQLNHQFTRVYFADEAEANATDPILNLVPAERRPTLLAQRKEQHGQIIYYLDIHMQGEQETVFFDA